MSQDSNMMLENMILYIYITLDIEKTLHICIKMFGGGMSQGSKIITWHTTDLQTFLSLAGIRILYIAGTGLIALHYIVRALMPPNEVHYNVRSIQHFQAHNTKGSTLHSARRIVCALISVRLRY